MEIQNSQLLLWNHCMWRGWFKNSNYCINKQKYKSNSYFIVTLLLSKLIFPLFIKTRESWMIQYKCDTTPKWNWLLSSWVVNPWINNKNNKLTAQNTQMFLLSPCVCVYVWLSHVLIFVTPRTVAHHLYPWDSPGKNTEVGCHVLLLKTPLFLLTTGIR